MQNTKSSFLAFVEELIDLLTIQDNEEWPAFLLVINKKYFGPRW